MFVTRHFGDEPLAMHSQLLYQIALTQIPGIGPVKAKALLAYCGTPEAIFKERQSALMRIPDIGEVTSASIQLLKTDALLRAEKEVSFIEKNAIEVLFYTDKKYPERLRLCDDGPIILFSRGTMDLNTQRIISVVGTRNATSYGKGFCEQLLSGIAHLKPLVVSGLAYGIDICAHRHAMNLGIQTVGVMAHGLDVVYPSLHLSAAREMENNGGLISEFVSQTKMSPEFFPMRNRIVAGIADCTIVIESDVKGGSLITAHLANSYGREVFALPGRHNDKLSAGCNHLIRKNIAAILSSPEDLIQYMNWDKDETPKPKQLKLLQNHSEEEATIITLLQKQGKLHIDQLTEHSGLTHGKLSGILLSLEFGGIVKSLPGKVFELE